MEKVASKGDAKKWLEFTCCYFYEHSDILKILFRYRTDGDFVLFLNERFNEQYPNLINKGYFALIRHTKSKQKLDLTVVTTYHYYIT